MRSARSHMAMILGRRRLALRRLRRKNVMEVSKGQDVEYWNWRAKKKTADEWTGDRDSANAESMKMAENPREHEGEADHQEITQENRLIKGSKKQGVGYKGYEEKAQRPAAELAGGMEALSILSQYASRKCPKKRLTLDWRRSCFQRGVLCLDAVTSR